MRRPFLSGEHGEPPELQLVRAVLDDALRLVFGERSARCTPRALYDVRAWVLAEDLHHPFSFLRVCEVLSIDPERLRTLLGPHLGLPRLRPGARS